MVTNARPRLESTTFPPFARLALAYAIGVAGDVFVTVSLADTLFFSATTGAGAPEGAALPPAHAGAVRAHRAGVRPADRPDARRSAPDVRGDDGRAGVLCLVMAAHVNGYALYPLAFGALVLSKTQSVTKSALVPG